MKTFEPISIGQVVLKNRIIRSATYEGRCDYLGYPDKSYTALIDDLAGNNAGGIITGFAFTSSCGRSMQVRQAGIESDEKISWFKPATQAARNHSCPLFLQISHAGRQTTLDRAGSVPGSSSSKESAYFRIKPREYTITEVKARVNEYALAALRARKAGFDGVQVHAAHGYLIHQFLLPAINRRKDQYGIDPGTRIGTRFLEEIIDSVRNRCGEDFPVLVKISCGVDLRKGFDYQQFEALIRFLDRMKVDAIEISYGTMDHPLNIFRGDFPVDLILKVNPLFNDQSYIRQQLSRAIINGWYKPRQKRFTPAYNLAFAGLAKALTNIPVLSVGGFRSSDEINEAIENGITDIVGMSRPFISEPDLVEKMKRNKHWRSECKNCNYCAVMCDSGRATNCYDSKKRRSYGTV